MKYCHYVKKEKEDFSQIQILKRRFKFLTKQSPIFFFTKTQIKILKRRFKCLTKQSPYFLTKTQILETPPKSFSITLVEGNHFKFQVMKAALDGYISQVNRSPKNRLCHSLLFPKLTHLFDFFGFVFIIENWCPTS